MSLTVQKYYEKKKPEKKEKESRKRKNKKGKPAQAPVTKSARKERPPTAYEKMGFPKHDVLKSRFHSDATAGINSNQKITKNGQKSPKKAIFGPKNSIFDLKTQKPPKTPSEASK